MADISSEGAAGRPETGGPPLVEARNIVKRFAGATALRDVSVTVHAGTVHAFVGENGAGKSTLGRIIAGAERPDGGSLTVDGREVDYRSPRDALDDGIALIAQELELVPQLTVAENIMLGQEPGAAGFVSRRRLRSRVRSIIASSGFGLDADRRVGDLGVAEQQQVEILRAVARSARLIVMDEPTAALTPDETEKLHDVIRHLVSTGAAVVYVSHFLKDVLRLASTITVLRNGVHVRTSAAQDESESSLVEAILGRSTDVVFPEMSRPERDAPVVLSARNITRRAGGPSISFEIHRGEIVGIAGLLGSGRSGLARALFRAEPLADGEVELDGEPFVAASPAEAFEAGLVLLPEDRRHQGLVMGMSIASNVVLPHLKRVSRAGFVSTAEVSRETSRTIERLGIAASSPSAPVGTLSGGNQQKVLLGKCLLRQPKLLILDEPTRGVDIGAKLTIYNLIRELAKEGVGVLLISSELEEVLGLAHRVLVMREGAVVADLENRELSPSRVMRAAFGLDAMPPSTMAVSA